VVYSNQLSSKLDKGGEERRGTEAISLVDERDVDWDLWL